MPSLSFPWLLFSLAALIWVLGWGFLATHMHTYNYRIGFFTVTARRVTHIRVYMLLIMSIKCQSSIGKGRSDLLLPPPSVGHSKKRRLITGRRWTEKECGDVKWKESARNKEGKGERAWRLDGRKSWIGNETGKKKMERNMMDGKNWANRKGTWEQGGWEEGGWWQRKWE